MIGFTVIVVGGYEIPPQFPLAEPEEPYGLGDKIAFIAASVLTLAMAIASWKGLVAASRRRAYVQKYGIEEEALVGKKP